MIYLNQGLHFTHYFIPAKPLHNREIVSVHFNHFRPCMKICNTLRRHLSMLTYIYLNVDECWLTYSIPQQRVKLQILLITVKPVTRDHPWDNRQVVFHRRYKNIEMYGHVTVKVVSDQRSVSYCNGLSSQYLLKCCNSRKCDFWKVMVALKAVQMNWFLVTHIRANLITNSSHAWLTKDYMLPGIIKPIIV